nr:putative head-tail connector protein [uncultured Mediterranean phage uvMED]BAR22049.1 putative head-tail connector protein [uncultured Mediterranean phage uvMED]BAR22089.1 putative head-tail connector protein [uncultured Mediterranean phage uvMED]BAR22119.1 putative head-tail connector protein [uncultured Mediterranean phage uvMED]BAR39014.1 putative head-tail connector protein [uncultured Mediterranean phage uvMED]
MAATITATLSSATANSYVTLAEANTYFETVPDSTTWDNKSDDQKNRSLIAATRWIDSFVFFGDRCDHGQALKFPRNNYQVDDVELACSAIPVNIKYAQYELARALANDTDAMTGNVGTNGNIAEAKLGDLAVKYNVASQGTGSVNNIMDVYPWLQSYLGAYMIGGAGTFQMRAVRG